jgi:hypothetical protein
VKYRILMTILSPFFQLFLSDYNLPYGSILLNGTVIFLPSTIKTPLP